ncbi:Adenine deaminase [Colletotrichum siamense]|uniref:Adenine deaminase n=1 Tax=Colletotrichum siamense TaxID=690259 RepID=UPI001872C06A|nr:Adenine deaminase [Colletotrichum siamense]KAF5483053.1 Adenine deaminase [Colletotrichum siamense]
MCFLRYLPVTSAAETLKSAIAGGHLGGDDDSGAICGFGLDSSGISFRPELFTHMYLEGEKRGVPRTAHGDEEGDPTYISGALDSLHAEHGVRLETRSCFAV